MDPDAEGFVYSNPMETSFKQRCLEEWKIHHRKLLRTLQNEGPAVLGDISESDYIRVEERLKKIIKGPEQNTLKPKAASKMIVVELKEELEAQGLPIDGTRNVLYQRVQKARRINRSRGRPLWVPPVEEEEEEVNLIQLIPSKSNSLVLRYSSICIHHFCHCRSCSYLVLKIVAGVTFANLI